jgi:cytochrome c556
MRANFLGMTACGWLASAARLRPSQLSNRDAAWKTALQKGGHRQIGAKAQARKRSRAGCSRASATALRKSEKQIPRHSPAQKMRANFLGMSACGWLASAARLRPSQLANRDAAWKAALQKRTARENGGEGAQIKRGRGAERVAPAPPPPSAGSVPRQRRR